MLKPFKLSNTLIREIATSLLLFLTLFWIVSASSATVQLQVTEENPITYSVDSLSDSESNPPIDIQGNGSKVQVQAGDLTRLRVRDRLQINLSLQENAELRINISETNPSGTLQNNTYRFGEYYQFELNKSTQLQARFSMQINKSELPKYIDPQNLSWAYFNNYSNSWEYAYSWWSSNQDHLITDTTHFSVWTVLEITDNMQPTPTEPKKDQLNEINANGTAMKLENGSIYRFKTQFGFEINVSLNKSAELKMNESLVNQYQNMLQNHNGIGKQIDIDLNDTGITIQATLAYKIKSSDIPPNIDPYNLTFAYYDTVNNQWKVQNSWVLNLGSGNYMICANTTHFSTWSIIGEVDTSNTSTNTSSNAPGFELLSLLSIPAIFVYKKKK